MNQTFKRIGSLVLVLSMVFSMLCVGVSATDVDLTGIPHLEVGAVSGTYKAGDTVEIPVYVSLPEAQCVSMVECFITAQTGIEVTGVTIAEPFCNYMYAEYPYTIGGNNILFSDMMYAYRDVVSSDGDLVFTIQATVTEDISTVTTTGVTLSDLRMNGALASTGYINVDETGATIDDAFTYPTDENGDPYGGIIVEPAAEFTMVATATPGTVVVDDEVTVNIAVNGADFVGFDYYLSWDSTQFTLKSAPANASDKGDSTYSHGGAEGNYIDGQTIATYTFTTLALADGVEEATFDLYTAHIAQDAVDAGTSSEPAAEVSTTDAVVKIAMDTMTATGDTNSVTYTGGEFSINEPTASESGVTYKYSVDDDDTYDLDAAPVYTEAGTYTTYWEASKLGYESVTGSSKLVIGTAALSGYSVTGNADVPYDGNAHESATVVEGTPEDAKITYSYEYTDNSDPESSFTITKTTTTVPTFTEVGEYEVSYEITLDNYTTIPGSYTFEIYNGTIDASSVGVYGKTYTGQPHSITVTVTEPEGTTTYYAEVTSDDDGNDVIGEYSTINPTFTDVGTHEIAWKVEKNGYTTAYGRDIVGIMTAPITVKANDETKVYGAEDPAFTTASVTGLVDGESEDVLGITYYRGVYEGSENVGTHYINPAITNDNYYLVSVEPAKLTITAASMEDDVTVTPYVGLEYNEKEQPSATYDIPEGATIQFSLDKNTWGDTVPGFVSAGDYTVYYKVTKANYTEVSSSYDFNIAIKTVDVIVNSATITYGDALPTYTVSNTEYLGAVLSSTATATSGAGTYPITVNSLSNPNYKLGTVTPGTLTIEQAEVTITVDGKTKYYGGEDPTFTSQVAGLVNNENESVLNISYSREEGEDTGDYAITASYNNDNYDVTVVDNNLRIYYARVTINVADADMVYGGTVPTFSHGVTFDNGVVTDEELGITCYTDESTYTPGTYTIHARYNDANDNFEVTKINTGTLTVTEGAFADYEFTPVTGAIYNGAPQTSATLTEGVPEDATITYTAVDGNGATVETMTYDATTGVPTFTDAGTYTVIYTLSMTSYESFSEDYTFTIAPAAVTIKADDASKTYGEADPALTYQPTSGAIYNEDDLGVTVSRASGDTVGTYDINIDASAANDNYTVTTDPGVFTINPKAITATIQDIANLTYDGTAKTPDVVVMDGETTIPASEYTVTYGNNINAGTATVTLVDVEGGNYTVAGSTTFTIDPLVVDVTVEDASKTYGDANPQFSVSNEEDLGTITYTCDADNTSAAGTTYAIGVDAISNGNYKLGDVTEGQLSITTRAATISVNNASKLFGADDPAFTSSTDNVVNGDDLGITYTRDAGETAGTYTITVESISNANYTFTVSQTGTLTIGAPTYSVEVSADEYIIGYNLVMVYTNTADLVFSYGDLEMYDISDAGYTADNGGTYTYVHGVLVPEGLDETKVSYTSGDATAIDYDGYDLNKSKTVDLNDVVACVAVYNCNETYLKSYMEIVFKADVDASKSVNTTDASIIKNAYL